MTLFIRTITFVRKMVTQNKNYMGRWNPMLDEIKKEERALRSSYDHCGDRLCGYPEKVKKEIDKNINK